MPIYAYKCSACGHAKDVLQKISDDLLTDCPACHAATFTKQLTAAGFQLKGSGWYATDFKGGPPNAPAPAAAESGAPASGASSSGDASGGGSSSGDTSGGAAASKSEGTNAVASSPVPTSTSNSNSTTSAASCGASCACH
jgi:putative FmdB family regulatory protein